MFLHFGHLIGILCSAKIVSSRFCEGGHICSLPRECCTQGCCPPYQSGPRQLPPASDHVLNLFFISHWFFWCVVVAVILAILCAYSLWKKRRTLCGWGFSEHHTQSEGDSAGSCYAPPQYSRCSSFHHPPPPYTEVTSKPDLYPLVFTCNSDNGKNGASYLMVQYFRNYIVRPAGSMSATSTVDSLSSSFICNANEANTLVPPPYSRATSPEIGFNSHYQQHYTMIPRSASQLVCTAVGQDIVNGNRTGNTNLATQQVYQASRCGSFYTTSTLNGAAGGAPSSMALALFNTTQLRLPDSSIGGGTLPLSTTDVAESIAESGVGNHHTPGNRNPRSAFAQSQSDQQFKYIANSNSSISDIFVNNSSCAAELGLAEVQNISVNVDDDSGGGGNNNQTAQTTHTSHVLVGGTPAIYSNGCIQTNPLHKAITSPKQLVGIGKNPAYNSSSSIGGISITVPVAASSVDEYPDLDVLRRSLETCCQFLQQQQQQQQQQLPLQQKPLSGSFVGSGDSPLRMHELTKKYPEEALRSYLTSGTCSAVSSLANIATPSSPPQATSPTCEVKEILDQIRQLQAGANCLDARPQLLHSISSPSPTKTKHNLADLQRFPTMPENHYCSAEKNDTSQINMIPVVKSGTDVSSKLHNLQNSSKEASNSSTMSAMSQQQTSTNMTTKRPSTLQQSKKKFFTPLKPNKAMYMPMMATNSNTNASIATHSRSSLKSPVSSVVGANFFAARGRMRKGWISRSAPTTPGTGLPPNRLGDDSPLLNEHDEDLEAEHHVEIE